MNFESDALTHLTPTLDNLKNILLDRGFIVKYCRETLELIKDEEEITYGVPMVSFFDLPLSRLKRHTDKSKKSGFYGTYGIGFSKEFSLRGLNPVLYMHKWSTLHRSFRFLHDTFLKGKDIPSFHDLDHHVLNIFRFSKNYQGKLIDREDILIDKEYKFSEEHEWRWVPEKQEKEIPVIISKDVVNNKHLKDEYNAKLKAKGIRFVFELQVIKHIIVEKNEDVKEISKLLTGEEFKRKPLPGSNYVRTLQSKIITLDQIGTE